MERNRDYSFVPSIQWGIANEDTTGKAFIQVSGEEHSNFHSIPQDYMLIPVTLIWEHLPMDLSHVPVARKD